MHALLLAAVVVLGASEEAPPAPAPAPPLVDSDVPLPPEPERRPEPEPEREPERGSDAPSVQSAPRKGSLLGIDSVDVARFFGLPPPVVDPSLLQLAPTTPGNAVLASAATTFTGVALLTTSIFFSPRPLFPLGAALGLLMMNFGPSFGDLLNGDWKRFLLMGFGRLALMVVSPFVPAGIFGWFAWVGWDTLQARHAPARWVNRTNAGASVTDGPGSGVGMAPSTPGAPRGF